MNSAAKLRNRGIAVIGATALIATSFGPAAMAWTPTDADPTTPAVETPAAPDDAGVATFGLIDADDAAAGTQGAQVLSAGVNGQSLADMRFVLPATWEQGDRIVFSLNQPAEAATNINRRISFAGQPSINIGSTPYAYDTHIQQTSPAASNTAAIVEGSVEAGAENAYQAPTGSAAPVAPQFSSITMGSSTNNAAYQDQIILTFGNANDTSATGAKFIGAINGAKVNVGSAVTAGEVTVTASAQNRTGTAQNIFWNGTALANSVTTAPAVVANGSLSVANAGVVADGTTQFVGPITVTRTDDELSGPLSVTLGSRAGVNNGAVAFDVNQRVTVKQFNNAGGTVGSDLTVTPGANGIALTDENIDAAATRIEISGAAVRVPTTTTQVTYAIDTTANGGITAPSVANTYYQSDIETPSNITSISIRPSQPTVDTRLAGFDRYSTATRLADELAKDVDGTPEVDSVILASGENYADALSAGYLAATRDAPVLLTTSSYLPGSTVEYLRTRGVKNVYIVGGTSAVSAGIENRLAGTNATDVVDPDATATPSDAGNSNNNAELRTLDQKINVDRIAGANRFVTNRNVNRYAYETSNGNIGTMVPGYGQNRKTTAIFVNGLTPWDALASGPLVDGNGTNPLPIVLTHGNQLEGQARGQIGDFGIQNAILVGGESVLPAGVVSDLSGRGVTSTRLGGTNRWETGKAVNDFLVRSSDAPTSTSTGAPGLGFTTTTSPFLVNGGTVAGRADSTKWADALAVGPVAAQERRVIALTDSQTLPSATANFLRAHTDFDAVTAVGGANVVSQAVIEAANALLGE